MLQKMDKESNVKHPVTQQMSLLQDVSVHSPIHMTVLITNSPEKQYKYTSSMLIT